MSTIESLSAPRGMSLLSRPPHLRSPLSSPFTSTSLPVLSRRNRSRNSYLSLTVASASSSSSSSDKQQRGGFFPFMITFKDFVDKVVRNIKGDDLPSRLEGQDLSKLGPTVLVAGASGRTGRLIVRRLLLKNFRVVAFVSSDEKGLQVLCQGLGLSLGLNPSGGYLDFAVGDLTDFDSVKAAVKGVDFVVCAVGTRYAPPAGFEPNGAPKEVYGTGIPNLVRAARDEFESREDYELLTKRQELTMFDFQSGGQLAHGEQLKRGMPSGIPGWFILNDAIMGGISDGAFQLADGGSAVFEGTLRSEGGGFSSIRSELKYAPLDLSEFDGVSVRVKGDGQRYKLGVRTQADFKGLPYVAMFNTVRNQWTDVSIPFDAFQAADQSNLVLDPEPLDTREIHAVQILASLFQFNKEPNPVATPGPFRLEIESIKAFKNPRPKFVLVSSAAVERSARAVTPEQRECSIPIVKLNPGGVLKWKLESEDVLRGSGLPYAVVRPCGLTDKDVDQTFLLEVAQGDVITGLISRDEAAEVVVEALNSGDVANTTFEVRRDELAKGLKTENFVDLFRRLRPDSKTGFVVLPPPLTVVPLATKEEDKKDEVKGPPVVKLSRSFAVQNVVV